MSRFHKLSQTLWHCQYQLIWCPKCRYRVPEEVSSERLKSALKHLQQSPSITVFQIAFTGYPSSYLRITIVGNTAWGD